MTSSVQAEKDSYDDPFTMIRNNFNFTFICEFLHHFSSAFFNGADDILPTTPVLETIYDFEFNYICLVYGALALISGRCQED